MLRSDDDRSEDGREAPASADARAIALARSHLYRFFSLALSYPDEGWQALWRQGIAERARHSARLLSRQQADGGGLAAALEALFRGGAVAPGDDLQAAYRRLFGHTLAADCALYELLYRGGDIFQQAHALADIAGWYRAFGLAIAPEAKERVDHIGVELEFMYVLTHKEAHALARGATDRAQLCVETQIGFLLEHLGRWGPLFARRLRQQAPPGFYAALAAALEAFFALELQRFGLSPVPLAPPGPAGWVGVDLACDGCPLLTGDGQPWREGQP
jgi:DMSO reductase family type II enzyme chaperone